MLFHQALSPIIFVLLLTAIGFGPAYLLTRGRPERLFAAAGFAPVLALALVVIAAFPLVRYLAPVEKWAWPATGALLAISLALLFRERATLRRDLAARARPLLLAAAFFLTLLAVRSSTIITGGLQHTVFQSQPADAYCYTTLAESLRRVPWPDFLAGADLTQKADAEKLALLSPTALYTARTALMPLRYNIMALEAYGAVVTGLETYKFYFPFMLAMVALLVPVTLLWAHRLGLPTPWMLAAGAVSLFGFWPQMLMQVDALGQVLAGLLALVIAYVTASLLVPDGGARWANFALLTVLLAGLGCTYTEFAPSLALALAVPLGFAVKEDRQAWKIAALGAAGALAAGALIAASGQLDWLLRYHRYRASEIVGETATHLLGPVVQSSVATAIFGLFPITRALDRTPVLWPLAVAFMVFTAALAVLFVIDAGVVFLRGKDPFARLLVSAVVTPLAAYTLLLLLQRNYSAVKALMFAVPFLPAALTAAFSRSRESGTTPAAGRPLATGLCALWIVLQLTVGAAGLRAESHATLMLADLMAGNSTKKEGYDLRAITKKLDEVKPDALLVQTPAPLDWRFRVYVNFAFAKYQPYFQSGVTVDNSNTTPVFFAGKLERIPDYVVIAKRDDYMEAGHLGEPLATSKNLRLYRVTTTDLEAFRRHEPVRQP